MYPTDLSTWKIKVLPKVPRVRIANGRTNHALLAALPIINRCRLPTKTQTCDYSAALLHCLFIFSPKLLLLLFF